MSIFQCDNCGCAENTATGWYWPRDNERLTIKALIGKALCSACAPTKYPNGEPTDFNGIWHGIFKRSFLPHGECFTNDEGNIEHRETGLIGNVLHEKLGKDEEYQ